PINTGIYTNIEDKFGTAGSTISISPNPTNGIINIVVDGDGFSENSIIWIYNTSGNLMEYFRWDGNTTTLNLSGYQKGIYVLAIQTNKGLEIKKITVL
ncbi:MAG: hypothetical protein B6D64_08115, partial [Bacteroidetes bacterium 4484_276]